MWIENSRTIENGGKEWGFMSELAMITNLRAYTATEGKDTCPGDGCRIYVIFEYFFELCDCIRHMSANRSGFLTLVVVIAFSYSLRYFGDETFELFGLP